MIIIYILAAIGGFCVISVVGLILLLLVSSKDETQGAETEASVCGLTNEKCIYTQERQTCNGCPIAEEAKKVNVVILTGRLTSDPDLRYTQQGTPCTSFNLAVDRASKNDEADFPTIIAWRETAEFANKYLRKGGKIVVRGEIRTRSYTGQDGKSHKVTEVQADRLEFADSKPQGPFA